MRIQAINNSKINFRAETKPIDTKKEDNNKQDRNKKLALGALGVAAAAIAIIAIAKKKKVDPNQIDNTKLSLNQPINPDNSEKVNEILDDIGNIIDNSEKNIFNIDEFKKTGKFDKGFASLKDEPFSGEIVIPQNSGDITIKYENGFLVESNKENGFLKKYKYNKDNKLEFVNDKNVLNYNFEDKNGIKHFVENGKRDRSFKYNYDSDTSESTFYRNDGVSIRGKIKDDHVEKIRKHISYLESGEIDRYQEKYYLKNGYKTDSKELKKFINNCLFSSSNPVKTVIVQKDGTTLTEEYLLKRTNYNTPLLFKKTTTVDKEGKIIEETIERNGTSKKGPKIKNASINGFRKI